MRESELFVAAFFFGVLGIASLINGDHFCLFQNTIFRLNSRVLCECLVIKELHKQGKVLIRINILQDLWHDFINFCVKCNDIQKTVEVEKHK